MKEIFDAVKRTTKNKLILLDTCFIIDTFSRHKEKELLELTKSHPIAMTSFNAEELEYVVRHKVKENHIKDRVRHFFKSNSSAIPILEIPVHPGNIEAEHKYVVDIDPYLAKDVIDLSDAVLAAAAIKTKSIIMTKDKHHLFTTILENYLHRWDLKVLKEMKDIYEL